MKTNRKNRAWLGLALVAAPSALIAQTEAKQGWSVEVKALDAETSGQARAFTLDDERTGASVGGAYAFNRYFSVHAAYADFGEHFATDCPAPQVCVIENVDQVDVKTLSVAAVGTWPVTPVIELFGKIGLASWDADFTRFRDESDRNVLYGAGIGARITPNWRVSLQYEKVDDFDLDSIGLGLSYRF